MALSNDMGAADIAALAGNGGGFGNDLYVIILFLFLFMGSGFGFGGFGGFGGGWGLGMGMENFMMWPWMMTQNTDNIVQQGFNQNATTNSLNNIQNSIASGFANAEVANCNREINALQTAYGNQIASMNQNFANVQAIDSRLDSLAMIGQKNASDNQLATVQTQNVVQAESAATRANCTANTQAILDKLCQLELDGVKGQLDAERAQNASLQNQLNMAAFRADNAAQTAALIADNTAQTQYVVNRVAPYPVPAYTVPPVYGYGYNGGSCYGVVA